MTRPAPRGAVHLGHVDRRSHAGTAASRSTNDRAGSSHHSTSGSCQRETGCLAVETRRTIPMCPWPHHRRRSAAATRLVGMRSPRAERAPCRRRSSGSTTRRRGATQLSLPPPAIVVPASAHSDRWMSRDFDTCRVERRRLDIPGRQLEPRIGVLPQEPQRATALRLRQELCSEVGRADRIRLDDDCLTSALVSIDSHRQPEREQHCDDTSEAPPARHPMGCCRPSRRCPQSPSPRRRRRSSTATTHMAMVIAERRTSELE